MDNSVSFISLGGIGDVTKNMYLYEYRDQILLVDCGLGFADESMVGVDLLLPDISYLLNTKKRIVGMVLTHGHEDHIGALPFILPQLLIPNDRRFDFQIFATPLTSALANEKLREFNIGQRVKTVPFAKGEVKLGDFQVSFIRVTHSVPDSSNLFIKTPVGNFYHASDFKFDFTPANGKRTDLSKIARAGEEGVLCLMSDSLGAERAGYTASEEALSESFEREMRDCQGKFIVTTYSSNISRLNQAIQAAERHNRKVVFIGRSLIKAKEVAQRLVYMKLREGLEVQLDQLGKYNDKDLMLLVAGSQAQENSSLSRIANNEHREVKLTADDVVIFSADPIPGNEVAIHSLIDTIAKKGTKVVYSELTDEFHVSGHGSSQDLLLMMSLTKPRFMLPIGGTFRQMVAYKSLAQKLGYNNKDIFLTEAGQEVIFTKNSVRLGIKLDIKNVYVDQITGEEVEHFVLRDRQKLSEGGVVIVMTEIDSSSGQMVNTPEIVTRGFTYDSKNLAARIRKEVGKALQNKKGRVTDWIYLRRLIGSISEKLVLKELHRRPLVIPVVIEV